MSISQEDASDLEWMFGRGGALVANDRSNFAQIERHGQYSTWGMRKNKELTARITAEVHVRNASEMDGAALLRFGKISKHIKALRAVDELAYEILRRYYGDIGFRCAVEDGGKYGRIACLYRMVPAGKKLVARSARATRAARGADQDEDDVLMNELKVEGVQSQPARAMLIEKARGQAQELYERAAASWNATKPQKE